MLSIKENPKTAAKKSHTQCQRKLEQKGLLKEI